MTKFWRSLSNYGIYCQSYGIIKRDIKIKSQANPDEWENVAKSFHRYIFYQ